MIKKEKTDLLTVSENEAGFFSDDNLLYSKNLEALRKHHSELVSILESTTVDGKKVRILNTESNDKRIIYKNENGEEIYIHSAVSPVKCANQAIELLGKMEKEGILVLFGFGLGYFAEEVFKTFEKGHVMLIYDAMPEIFKAAMHVRDFSELFASEKVKIIVGQNTDNFSVIYAHHHLIANGKFWVVNHEPSIKMNPEAYEIFFKRLNEEKRITDLGVATVVNRGKEFINAFLSNIPSIIRNPGVGGLRDIFKGTPSIVVSAGPSLEKNMHLLKKAKGKAVIIATGGALPTLLLCNIIPDMVVEIDPVSQNIEDKFSGIPILKDVPFVCLAQYTPELINIYPGPLLISAVTSNIAYVWLSSFFQDLGYIECFGGSVAHLAFATAQFVGSDVIAFVGQDLSYSGNRVHVSGYDDNLDRRLKDGLDKGMDAMPGSMRIKDIFDEEVFTITQFLSFKSTFEARIRDGNVEVINATEGGIPIEGTTSMRLTDFIDEYCNGLAEIDATAILSGLKGRQTFNFADKIVAEITEKRDKFAEIRKTSKQILKYIKIATTLKSKGQRDSLELNNILSKIEKNIENVRHPFLNLLVSYHYGLELYLRKQNILEIDEIEDKWEMLDKQLKRGQVYYSELVKAIDLFNNELGKVLSLLKSEQKIDVMLKDESIEKEERFYKAGMLYKKAELAVQAVKYLEAANVEVRSTDPERLFSLAEMYLKQFRYYEAKDILIRLASSQPTIDVSPLSVTNKKGKGLTQTRKIKELLQECDEKIKVWENRKREMEKLLVNAEKNYGGALESGYFYFRVKNYVRAEKAYLTGDTLQVTTDKEAVTGDGSRVTRHGLFAAYYGLAHVYIAKEEGEKAVKAFEKAIDADPKNPLPYRDLGMMAYQNNNIESAELFFTRAIELAPQAIELYKLLCDLYVGQSEVQKAISLYEDALLVNPDNPVIQKELVTLYQLLISRTGTA